MNSCEQLLDIFTTCSKNKKLTCTFVNGNTFCNLNDLKCKTTNKDDDKIMKLITNKKNFEINYTNDEIFNDYPRAVYVEIGFEVKKK